MRTQSDASLTAMANLQMRIRVLHGEEIAMGPGKADLLEAIMLSGSISQAAKGLGMSYRRAWLLIATMNQCFVQPVVVTKTGGSHGGGAEVTVIGQQALALFRQMEQVARISLAGLHADMSVLLSSSHQPPSDEISALD